MTNWDSKSAVTITHGNGSSAKADKKGDLSGVICNTYGEEIQPVTLKGVKYVPDSEYNLFSISQRVKHGWEVGGNKETGLFLKKGEHK